MEQPKGLFVLSGTEMWERFSFYTIVSILVLFMVEVLHFGNAFAALIFGIISASTYVLQICGGYISDNYIGNRKAIYLGGFLMMIGQFILAYSASLYASSVNIPVHSSFIFTFQENVFIIGAVVLALGSGFFKVNISSLVGLLYEADDSRLDSAYTIFYMGVNVGALMALLVTTFVVGSGHSDLFQYGFLIAGIGLGLGLVMFTFFKDKYLRSVAGEPIGVIATAKDKLLLSQREDSGMRAKLSKIEIDRLYVIFVLSIMMIIFVIGSEQKFTSLTFFIQNHVNTAIPIIQMSLPPEFFLLCNAVIIIVLAPIFAKLWLVLNHRNKEPSVLVKVGIGLIILAISYIILLFCFNIVENGTDKVAMTWILVIVLVQCIAELLISPIGLSLVTKLAPVKYVSSFMGVWFVAMAIGEILAGYFAGFYPSSTGAVTYFLGFIPISNLLSFAGIFIVISLIFGIACLVFKNKIIKLMHGVK